MNAEALLKHYELVADGPDAIARLRCFVLELAVRGKLLQQDTNDEPVPAALKRQKISVSSLSPFEIPASWAWVNVGAVAEARLGKMLDKAKNRGTPRRYLRNINVRWSDFNLSDVLEMPFEDSELAEFALRIGDVLICEGGEPGRAAVWDGRESDIYFQKAIHRVRFANVVSSDYFVMALRASADDGRLTAYFTGTGIKHFTGKGLDSYVFPLPSIAEQHRIVAKVDELMALCDRLEAARVAREATRDRLAAASLARLNTPDPDPETFKAHASFAISTALPALTTRPDQIKQLRQAILNLAVRGKLVMQDPNDEQAARMVQRAKASKQAAYNAEGLRVRTPLTYPTRDDLKFDFPLSWELAAFDELFVIVSGVTLGQKIPVNESIDAPYLRVANVQRGYLALDVIKTIPVRKSDLQRYALRAGDVLMTEGGDWDKLGRAAIWQCAVPNCIHQNHVFRVRPPSVEILSEWVTTYVNSLLGRAFFEDASKQTTNLASINMTQLRSCPIPVPPTAEQHRIVTKVNELMQLCDRLESSLRNGAETRCRLLDALLHEALQTRHDNVIDFVTARRTLLAAREAVACRIVERLASTRGFGRVRAVKPLYFAETHCGVALGGQWGRADFGPFDQWIFSFESHATSAGWFSVAEKISTGGGTRIEYKPGAALSNNAQAAAKVFGDQAAEFERILTLLANLNTEESEIVATLYAAWNDLMLDGKPVSDEIVISEFREHWHSRKASFDPGRLRVWLDWIRRNRLVPKGQGPSTRHQAELI